jgi:hypothetical protein
MSPLLRRRRETQGGKECASPLLKRESSSRFTASLSDSGPLKITAEKIVQLDEPVSPKKTVTRGAQRADPLAWCGPED